jgi:hypothetical protein
MKKVTKQKRPQPWTWAQAHEERVRKHWNGGSCSMRSGTTRKAQYTCGACRSAHYGWKAFGFDGKHKPIWTIAGYVDMVENYEDPSDYVGMGWVGSDGRP